MGKKKQMKQLKLVMKQQKLRKREIQKISEHNYFLGEQNTF